MFYSYLRKGALFLPQSSKDWLYISFSPLTISSVQNTIIIGNKVYILSDLDDVVQEVGFEQADPAFVVEVVALSVQAIYQDSFHLAV